MGESVLKIGGKIKNGYIKWGLYLFKTMFSRNCNWLFWFWSCWFSGLIFADRIRSNDSSPSNFERVILDSLHQCQYNLRELSESNVTIGECVNHCAKTCNEALESTLDDSLDSNLDNPDQCPSQLRTCRLYLERCRRTDPSPGTLPYTPTNPIYTSNSPNLRG